MKVYKVVILIFLLITLREKIYAEENLENYLKEMNLYLKENNIEGLDIEDLSNSMLKGEKLEFKKIYKIFFKEIQKELKTYVAIFAIIFLINLINILAEFKGNEIRKISSMVILIIISQKILICYTDVLKSFEKTIEGLNAVMQITIPFITILNGLTKHINFAKRTMPIVLIMSQVAMVIANKIIIPISTFSIILGVITYINENNMLKKFSKSLNKLSFTALAIIFSLFICILTIEGNISVNIDNIFMKTARVATNTIPVVGKYITDSLGAITSSFSLIKNIIGSIAFVVMFLILITPIIKICISIVLLSIFENLLFQVEGEFNVSSLFNKFKDAYILLASVLVFTIVTFTISIGIMITITKG